MCILIVEDNPISQRMVEMILQSNGLETISAKSGRQAVQKIATRDDIQLVLTDLMMPEMDGYQLLEAMARNESWKQIPVIVMTSLSDADTVRRVVLLGCKNYVVKPVREEALIPKVKQLMREPSGGDRSLKAKFNVLEVMGISNEKYEELFDAFYQQVKDAEKLFDNSPNPSGTDDALGSVVKGLREGATLLAQGQLPLLIEEYRTRATCDWKEFRVALSTTSKAMGAAVEKRALLRWKVAARSEAIAPSP